MKRPKEECEESELNPQDDMVVCRLLGDVPCGNYYYLFYNVGNCPRLTGTEYDPVLNSRVFKAKQWVVEATIKVFRKNFLRV